MTVGGFHRGGSGPSMVLLHGFTDTGFTWTSVLAGLAAHHDVIAPTMLGHYGGPPLPAGVPGAHPSPDTLKADWHDCCRSGAVLAADRSRAGEAYCAGSGRSREGGVSAVVPVAIATGRPPWVTSVLAMARRLPR